MKSNQLSLLLYSFSLLLGKSIFDIHYLSDFIFLYNSNEDIVSLFLTTSIIGLLTVIVFNFLQRSFLYRVSIIYLFAILSVIIGLCLINEYYKYNKTIDFLLAGLTLSSNLLIILSQKGIASRLPGKQNKSVDKVINLGNSAGIAISSLSILYFKDLFPNTFTYNDYIYFASFFLIASAILISMLFNNFKSLNYLQDNLQVIKVKQQFYKLVFQKYFFTILILMSLVVSTISISYAFFIDTNTIRYSSTNEVLNLFSILTLVYAIISIAYEFFLKERLTYTLNMKFNLQLLPLILVSFGIVFLLNSFVISINIEHEFFFFVSIFAVLFLIFTQFIFLNIFYPAINRLYLPLDSTHSNDFFIKSSFYGIFIGMGLGGLAIKFLTPEINIEIGGNYIISILAISLIIFQIIRFGVYPNYKKALHKRLAIESQSEFHQESFISNIFSNLSRFEGSEWIRIINLVQLINPIKAKEILKILSTSENTISQRIGIIGAIKYYLLNIYEDALKISKTKYYASSPIRDKIDELIYKFNEVERKMLKKSYISQLSISKKADERYHSSLIVEHAPKEDQKQIINRLINDSSIFVNKSAIVAAEKINSKSIIKSTIQKLGNNETSNAAFSTLVETGDSYIDLLEDAFNSTGQKEKIQLRIIQILGRIGSEKSVEILIKKLNHTNQNIVSEALTSLSNCNLELPEDKKYTIIEELEDTCNYIVWNTQYIIDLEKYNASLILIEAMNAELTDNYKRIFNLLSLLYNPGSIELIRKNLNSGKTDKIIFALELATVILKDEIKPYIIPLLRPLKNEIRLKKLNTKFITESTNLENLLYDLIQRDIKWINAWTKACAIIEIQKVENIIHKEILLANILNPDPLIAELSANTLQKLDNKTFKKNIKSLKEKLISIIGRKSFEYIEMQQYNTLEMPILKYEIISYLHSIQEFKSISGEIIKEITNNIETITAENGDIIYKANHYEIRPFFFAVYEGKAELEINGKRARTYDKNEIISSIDIHLDYNAEIIIKSLSNSKFYVFDTFDLINKLNQFDTIPTSIINNTKVEIIEKNNRLLVNDANFKKTIKNKMEIVN